MHAANSMNKAAFMRAPMMPLQLITPIQQRNFTGKTEDGFKWRTPKMRMRKVKRVPAPGDNLKIPEDLDPETFCKQIGGDCDDIADKFETIDEIFTMDGVSIK